VSREHEIKNNIVGNGFSEPVYDSPATRVNYCGQIKYAQGFESEKM